jgi:hypothetical protein
MLTHNVMSGILALQGQEDVKARSAEATGAGLDEWLSVQLYHIPANSEAHANIVTVMVIISGDQCHMNANHTSSICGHTPAATRMVTHAATMGASTARVDKTIIVVRLDMAAPWCDVSCYMP